MERTNEDYTIGRNKQQNGKKKNKVSTNETKEKKGFYKKRFDISMNVMKFLSSSGKKETKQKEKDDADLNQKCKSKKVLNGECGELISTEEEEEEEGEEYESEEQYESENEEEDSEEEEEEEEDNSEEDDSEEEEEDDDDSEDEEDESEEENESEDEEENEEEEKSEIIVSHGVFTYCLIEAIIEFKENELKNNILENPKNTNFLPMTVKNLITVIQKKIQNMKNKKLKKLSQKPEFTIHPGSNANINNYFIYYSKNIHFQNEKTSFLGYDFAPYLNVIKAWEQVSKDTLKQQKSLTLTTSLNQVARHMSMTAGSNQPNIEIPQYTARM